MHDSLLRTFGLAALGALSALSAFGFHAAALAEDSFPSRPITIVVPFPPGGGGDVQTRLVAQTLGEKLGQTVIVDSKPGAGTAIGAAFVANAKPDGYTLLMSSASTYTLNPAIRKSLPYDPIKSFAEQGVEAGLLDSAKAAAQLETELPLMRAVAARANIQTE